KIPMHSTGIEASRPASPCEMPRLAWMLGRSGPMAMTWGRKTRATARSATRGFASDRIVRPAPGSVTVGSARLGSIHVRDDLAFADPYEDGLDAGRARGRPFAVDEPARDQHEVAGRRVHPDTPARSGFDRGRARGDVDIRVVAGMDVPAGDDAIGRPQGSGPHT